MSNNTECVYEFEGSDVPDVEWYRCLTHDVVVLGDEPTPCEYKLRYIPDYHRTEGE